MAKIDGFEYEPYERSSGVARRDFRHASGGPEELPAKTLGKPKRKKERHKGCPENDGGAHIYVVAAEEHYFQSRTYIYKFMMCLGCGKRKRFWTDLKTSEVYTIV